ncbi:MAG: FG-GAP-like repeat-containing protein, partial [Planctomycetota bacterium]|nr:FG-GAP-like repeat-containing protein [Planctomycetota bacterium]
MSGSTKKVLIGGVLAAAGVAIWIATRAGNSGNAAPPIVDPVLPPPGRAIRLPDVRFTDVTAAAGIRFVHNNGAAGRKLLPETMGSGCAFLDFDNDGDADLLLVNSRAWPDDRRGDGPMSTPVLYENDGTGRFSDVTERLGLGFEFYGMGVT